MVAGSQRQLALDKRSSNQGMDYDSISGQQDTSHLKA